jgi:hypothetical protein
MIGTVWSIDSIRHAVKPAVEPVSSLTPIGTDSTDLKDGATRDGVLPDERPQAGSGRFGRSHAPFKLRMALPLVDARFCPGHREDCAKL